MARGGGTADSDNVATTYELQAAALPPAPHQLVYEERQHVRMRIPIGLFVLTVKAECQQRSAERRSGGKKFSSLVPSSTRSRRPNRPFLFLLVLVN